MKFPNFFFICGLYLSSWIRTGFRIRIHCPDWIRIHSGCGSATLGRGRGGASYHRLLPVSPLRLSPARLWLGQCRNSYRRGWVDADQVLLSCSLCKDHSEAFPVNCFPVDLWNFLTGWVWSNCTRPGTDKKICYNKFFFKIVQFVDYICIDFIRRELLNNCIVYLTTVSAPAWWLLG